MRLLCLLVLARWHLFWGLHDFAGLPLLSSRLPVSAAESGCVLCRR